MRFFVGFNRHQALSAFLVPFAVIDALGSTAIVIRLRKRVKDIAILSLKSAYAASNSLCGILANFVFVYAAFRCSEWIENKLGSLGINMIHKVMGVALPSVAVKLLNTIPYAQLDKNLHRWRLKRQSWSRGVWHHLDIPGPLQRADRRL